MVVDVVDDCLDHCAFLVRHFTCGGTHVLKFAALDDRRTKSDFFEQFFYIGVMHDGGDAARDRPGICKNLIRSHGDQVTAGCRNGTHRSDHLLFFAKLEDCLINFLRRGNASARCVEPQHNRTDFVVFIEFFNLINDLLGIADDSFNRNHADLCREAERIGSPKKTQSINHHKEDDPDQNQKPHAQDHRMPSHFFGSLPRSL